MVEEDMDQEDRDHFKTIGLALRAPQRDLQKQQDEENLNLVRDPAYTLHKAEIIFSCYRRDETQNPEIYAAAVAAVLSGYPKSVIDYVCDPRTGVIGKHKWLPSVAEIKAACDGYLDNITSAVERQRRIEKQFADREADERTRKESRKLSYEELKAKYGDDKGGWFGEGLKQRIYTEAEKQALLDDARDIGQTISGMTLLDETKTLLEEQNKRKEGMP